MKVKQLIPLFILGLLPLTACQDTKDTGNTASLEIEAAEPFEQRLVMTDQEESSEEESVAEEEKLNPETLTQPTPIPEGEPELELPEENAPPEISITPEPTKKK